MSCCSNFKLKNFTRKISVEEILAQQAFEGTEKNLNRVLSWYDVIANGIAATVGAGIFVTSGVAAHQAGPAIVLSFIASAFAALLSALCYAEMGARMPLAGSAYTFTYATLGEFMGWITGWNITLEYAISASAVAVGWGGYVLSLLRTFVVVPVWFNTSFEIGTVELAFSPISVSIIVVVTIILLFGVKESTTFNLVITIVNVSAIVFIIILGFFHVEVKNWSDFFPVIPPYQTSYQGIFAAAGTLFFSYIGFDAVTTLAGEVKNPKRDLPVGIIGSLLITTILYIGVSLSLTGMVAWQNISTTAPLSDAFAHVGVTWAAVAVGALSITTLTATVLTTILGQPRIYYQMASDGLLFSWFASLNKNQVPVFGTIFTGVIAGLLALLFNLDDLAHMISAGTLISYAIVCSCVVLIRYTPADDFSTTQFCIINSSGWNNVFRFLCSHKIFLLVWFYIFASCFAVSLKESFSNVSLIVYGSGMFIIYLIFQLMKQQDTPEGFACPLVPLIPFLGTAVNLLLIFQLPWEALARLGVWTAIGTLIYVLYGIHFSKLNNPGSKKIYNVSQ